MQNDAHILNVPTEIRIREQLQSHGVDRRSEAKEEAIYREFVESVTVASEVMEVLVRMPEIASIEQAREYLRETGGTRRAASTEMHGRGGLRSAATRFWRHVVALLSPDVLGNPRSRYPRELTVIGPCSRRPATGAPGPLQPDRR